MKEQKKKAQGQVRQGQVVNIYGPGAMTDLEKFSVLISGLDFWFGGMTEVQEPRLCRKIADVLRKPSIRLQAPPEADQESGAPPSGMPAFVFPEWFVTQDLQAGNSPEVRKRRLVPRAGLTKWRFLDDGTKKTVVPVRFVRACRNGHIGDLDWYMFVHSGRNTCAEQTRPLYIEERGTSGDLGETWVRCDCGAERAMSIAADPDSKALGSCNGARPWLGPAMKEKCAERNRLLVRSAFECLFSAEAGSDIASGS